MPQDRRWWLVAALMLTAAVLALLPILLPALLCGDC